MSKATKIAVWVAAVAGVVSAFALVTFLMWMQAVLASVDGWKSDRGALGRDSGIVSVVQAGCLVYSDFVVRQSIAGLSAEQIEAVIVVSGSGARGGSDAAGGLSVDDPAVCGSVPSVLQAAGLPR